MKIMKLKKNYSQLSAYFKTTLEKEREREREIRTRGHLASGDTETTRENFSDLLELGKGDPGFQFLVFHFFSYFHEL
jgi:ferritin